MKALAVVIGFVLAVTVATLAVVLAFPDRLGDYLPEFLQPSVGGPQLVLQVEPDGGDASRMVANSITIIERRLKDLGVRFSAQPQGEDRILLSLSKSADANRVVEVATRRGRLEFRLVEVTPWANMTPEQAVRGQPPADAEELYGRGGRGERLPYRVYKRAMLTGRDLVDAQAGFDQRTSEPIVSFRFNANGARQFAQATQENVGKPFAMVFDNEVISAPIIREPILGGMGQISGGFTVQQAIDMAILLRSGELPGRLTVIEQRSP
jgi:preprotein translocase subunit SecD